MADLSVSDDVKLADIKKMRRKYWKKEREYWQKGREAFLNGNTKSPVCRKCFYDDFHDGKTKNWKDYCSMELVREVKDMDTNPRSHNYGKQLGWTYDFKCKNEHGVSLSVLLGEMEDGKKPGKKN